MKAKSGKGWVPQLLERVKQAGAYHTFYVWYDLQNMGISETITVNPHNKQSLKRGQGS